MGLMKVEMVRCDKNEKLNKENKNREREKGGFLSDDASGRASVSVQGVCDSSLQKIVFAEHLRVGNDVHVWRLQ
jgi:hypothetical protein